MFMCLASSSIRKSPRSILREFDYIQFVFKFTTMIVASRRQKNFQWSCSKRKVENHFKVLAKVLTVRICVLPHLLCGINNTYGAIMADPSHVVSTVGERDTVHPATAATWFKHHLTKWHFGSPRGRCRAFFHFFNIGREDPVENIFITFTLLLPLYC